MSSTEETSQALKSEVNKEAPWNMRLMSWTEVMLQLARFEELSEEAWRNMEDISWTFATSQAPKSESKDSATKQQTLTVE